ncbi:MAG: hypothetical protein WCL08_13665 [Verrucomicrobiota bacterium]
MKYAKILRAARAASKYDKGHRWEPGIMLREEVLNGGFKPGYIDDYMTPEMDEMDNSWEGDFGRWDDALEQAQPGIQFDFYVYNRQSLVTNVGIKLISETEAIVCGCGDKAITVSLDQP